MGFSISESCHLHYQANLDFPKESIHKHLSNFKLQAKLS